MDDKDLEEEQQPVDTTEGDAGAEGVASQEESLSEEESAISPDPRIEELEAQVGGLSSSLEEREESIQKLTSDLEERGNAVSQLQEQLMSATSKYRDVLLSSVPEVPQELVRGQTIEELEASMAEARQTVERIRNQIEAQAASERVPAGAPLRSAPDLSALSPAEKIAYALGRNQG